MTGCTAFSTYIWLRRSCSRQLPGIPFGNPVSGGTTMEIPTVALCENLLQCGMLPPPLKCYFNVNPNLNYRAVIIINPACCVLVVMIDTVAGCNGRRDRCSGCSAPACCSVDIIMLAVVVEGARSAAVVDAGQMLPRATPGVSSAEIGQQTTVM